MKSEQINELATALAAAQGILETAKLDSINPHFRNEYASLSSIWAAARAAFPQHGLSVVQTFEPSDGKTITLTTTLLHKSGQWISSQMTMVPQKNDPQGMGSAATYCRRYSLAAILGITTDDDDDDGEKTRVDALEGATQVKSIQKHGQAGAGAADQVPGDPAPDQPAIGRDWPAGTAAVRIHFGKNKGAALGSLAPAQLQWYVTKWQPGQNGQAASAADQTLRNALDEVGLFLADQERNQQGT